MTVRVILVSRLGRDPIGDEDQQGVAYISQVVETVRKDGYRSAEITDDEFKDTQQRIGDDTDDCDLQADLFEIVHINNYMSDEDAC